MEGSLIGIIASLLCLWLGSIEVRMRTQNQNLLQKPSRAEVSEEIKVRQEALRVMQQEIKEDLRDIKKAIVRLADKN